MDEDKVINIQVMLTRAAEDMERRFEQSSHSDGKPLNEQFIGATAEERAARIHHILERLTEGVDLLKAAVKEPLTEPGPVRRFRELVADTANRAVLLGALALYQD